MIFAYIGIISITYLSYLTYSLKVYNSLQEEEDIDLQFTLFDDEDSNNLNRLLMNQKTKKYDNIYSRYYNNIKKNGEKLNDYIMNIINNKIGEIKRMRNKDYKIVKNDDKLVKKENIKKENITNSTISEEIKDIELDTIQDNIKINNSMYNSNNMCSTIDTEEMNIYERDHLNFKSTDSIDLSSDDSDNNVKSILNKNKNEDIV